MYSKRELRSEMAAVRRCVDGRADKEISLSDKLLNLLAGFNSTFIYVSMGSEADTKRVIRAIFGKSKVLVPFTPAFGPMRPVLLTTSEVLNADKRGNLDGGFEETNIGPEIVVAPLLAFNAELYRLGYGGGYYDRYLCGSSALKVGLAFDEQYTDKLLADEFDVPLDMVLTPDKVYKCKTMPNIIW